MPFLRRRRFKAWQHRKNGDALTVGIPGPRAHFYFWIFSAVARPRSGPHRGTRARATHKIFPALGASGGRPAATAERAQDGGRTRRKGHSRRGPRAPLPVMALADAAYRINRFYSDIGGRPGPAAPFQPPSFLRSPRPGRPGGSVTHRSPSVERMLPGWLMEWF